MNKNAIAFDFDGVIHNLSDGWQGGKIYGSVNEDVLDAIYELNKMKIPIFICSSRAPSQIVEWWNKQDFDKLKLKAKVIDSDTFFFNDTDYIGVTQRKLPAQLYVDDRAYKYTGETKAGLILAAIGKEARKGA